MHSVDLSNTYNTGSRFYCLGLFAQGSYTVVVDSRTQGNHKVFISSLSKANNNSVYTALCKQNTGPTCVCVTVQCLTPQPKCGMHQKLFSDLLSQ